MIFCGSLLDIFFILLLNTFTPLANLSVGVISPLSFNNQEVNLTLPSLDACSI